MAPTTSLVHQGHKVLLVGTAAASPSDLTQTRDNIIASVGPQGSVSFEQLDRIATSNITFYLFFFCLVVCSTQLRVLLSFFGLTTECALISSFSFLTSNPQITTFVSLTLSI